MTYVANLLYSYVMGKNNCNIGMKTGEQETTLGHFFPHGERNI